MTKIQATGDWDGGLTWGVPTVAPTRQKVLGCVATLSASIATGLSLAGVTPVVDWHSTGANMNTSYAFFYTVVCFVSVRDLQRLLGVTMTPRWIVKAALRVSLAASSLVPYTITVSPEEGR